MENQQAEQPKAKKKGKIERVYELHQKGKSVEEIAKKTKLSERVVRSYIWRKKNPDKYKALLERYFSKKKGNQAAERSEVPQRSGGTEEKPSEEE